MPQRLKPLDRQTGVRLDARSPQLPHLAILVAREIGGGAVVGDGAPVAEVLDGEAAEIAAREAAAAALRLCANGTAIFSELLNVPAELEREAKPVAVTRAKEVVEQLRARADRPPRSRRTRHAHRRDGG
ncbi:hypothetical protein [Streptomyces boluensis]|uniref:Uncharacterized protein n=1 Tax=Streptomyces boluensis TaxID=1775135 RepID=A0A964UQ89_9ACTN|nr:hypothetical protein [Streptomyces boluensis]NBE53429.1 hypothetical protein [Streptomyces boluensis]